MKFSFEKFLEFFKNLFKSLRYLTSKMGAEGLEAVLVIDMALLAPPLHFRGEISQWFKKIFEIFQKFSEREFHQLSWGFNRFWIASKRTVWHDFVFKNPSKCWMVHFFPGAPHMRLYSDEPKIFRCMSVCACVTRQYKPTYPPTAVHTRILGVIKLMEKWQKERLEIHF